MIYSMSTYSMLTYDIPGYQESRWGSRSLPVSHHIFEKKNGDSPANLLNQPRCWWPHHKGAAWVPHTRASLEPRIFGFLTLRINHYAARGGVQVLSTLDDPQADGSWSAVHWHSESQCILVRAKFSANLNFREEFSDQEMRPGHLPWEVRTIHVVNRC